jgi:hypothetical protein
MANGRRASVKSADHGKESGSGTADKESAEGALADPAGPQPVRRRSGRRRPGKARRSEPARPRTVELEAPRRLISSGRTGPGHGPASTSPATAEQLAARRRPRGSWRLLVVAEPEIGNALGARTTPVWAPQHDGPASVLGDQREPKRTFTWRNHCLRHIAPGSSTPAPSFVLMTWRAASATTKMSWALGLIRFRGHLPMVVDVTTDGRHAPAPAPPAVHG